VDVPLILTFGFGAIACIAVAWLFWIKQAMAREAELLQTIRERTAELEEANRRLEALSYGDGLTGIHNRRAFGRALDIEWRRAIRSKRPLSVVMIDIDHFKTFNDTYGHPAGDSCLVSVASALSEVVRRAADTLARYGGEEFVALLPETDRTGAAAIAERMRIAVERLAIAHSGGIGGRVTVSVGHATIIASEATTADLLASAADVALYEAKRGGRNRAAAAAMAPLPTSSRG
jgi:diguanylate cyclase (GGDEF)-like protein